MEFIKRGCVLFESLIFVVRYVGVDENGMEALYLAAWCGENNFREFNAAIRRDGGHGYRGCLEVIP